MVRIACKAIGGSGIGLGIRTDLLDNLSRGQAGAWAGCTAVAKAQGYRAGDVRGRHTGTGIGSNPWVSPFYKYQETGKFLLLDGYR